MVYGYRQFRRRPGGIMRIDPGGIKSPALPYMTDFQQNGSDACHGPGIFGRECRPAVCTDNLCPVPRIEIHLDGRRIIECPMGDREVVLGRSPDATVVLPASEVSRVHARIRPAAGGYELAESGVNGTFLNGRELTGRATLSDGDEIRIGPYSLRFRLAPAAPASPTPVNVSRPTRLLRLDAGGVTVAEADLEVEPPGKVPKFKFSLPERTVVIGKGAGSDLVLADEFVSRAHARLVPVPDGWRIEDLGSRNGTRVNNRDTGAALLADGDRIRIGETRLTFRQKIRREPEVALLESAEDGEADAGASVFRGSHPSVVKLRRLARRIAPSGATVLVLGETGTGKEVFARLLHELSSRAGRPFVAVNCGALPAGLVESELFGHEPGAFTGATARKTGLFVAAGEGTLFLDEAGELTPEAQVKLLRAIEGGEVRPVGARETLRANPRIVAATCADLKAMVRSGRFRDDLYYRLNVVPVHLPPLRERRSDIPELAASFLGEGRALSAAALDRLKSHDWPGNIRELRNTVERAAILSPGEVIGPEAVLPGAAAVLPDGVPYLDSRPEFLGKNLDEIEKEIIRRVLADAGGVPARAAKLLGLTRSSLRGKMIRYGLAAGEVDA